MSEEQTHKALVMRADKWLKGQNWKVVIRDCFRAYTYNNEQPDVIAFRDSISLLIECKVSRADFLSDKNKKFRQEGGMGDWRFYLCPVEMIKPQELPPGWGLLYATDKRIMKIHGWPSNTMFYNNKPFTGSKNCENQVLVSALRRFAVRGQLDVIYERLE